MDQILITGANRGLGLELTRRFIDRGDRVFAGARSLGNALALRGLAAAHPDRLEIVELDVADTASIDASYECVRKRTDRLDILINNAGVLDKHKNAPGFEDDPPLGELEADLILETYRVNAVAPVMMVQRYLELLKGEGGGRSIRKVVNMSSHMGSIGSRTEGGLYTYCSSKAALNMLTRSLAYDLIGFGIVTVALHPGWVQTDMGGPGATLTPQESVKGLLQVIDGLKAKDAGRFLRYSGEELPW